MRLAGHISLITGGGSGIGQVTALAFAREGATVIVTGRRGDTAEATANEIRNRGGTAHTRQMDVTAAESVEETFAWMDNQGLLADVIFNCAGGSVTGDQPVHGLAEDVWAATIALNLKGPYLVCKFAIARLIDQQKAGSIINVSARSALNGIPANAYAAAKGGLAVMSRSIGVTYADKGIRCNAIAPGPIETLGYEAWQNPANRPGILRRIPMGRPGQPEEVAALAIYLASDESSFVTATLIPIDGGTSAI